MSTVRTRSEAPAGNVGSQTGNYHASQPQPSYFRRCESQLREIVEDREGRTVLVALAAGFATGLLIGNSFVGPNQRRGWTDRSTAEGIGRRLLNKIDQILPDALSDRLSR